MTAGNIRQVEKNRYIAHEGSKILNECTFEGNNEQCGSHMASSCPPFIPIRVTITGVFTEELVVATCDETNLNAEQSKTEVLSHSNRTPVMMMEIKVIMMI